jgi:hypothetical protein
MIYDPYHRNPNSYNGDLLLMIMIFILMAFLSLAPLASAVADSSEMTRLISANEDPHMNAQDLAFFLVTHDFDAVPKKDYVDVHLNNVIYKVVPNGSKPGLADVTIMS